MFWRHEIGDQRLAGGIREGPADAKDEQQPVDKQDLPGASDCNGKETQRSTQSNDVADHQNGPAVVPVGRVSGNQGQGYRRQERSQADQAESEGVPGQVIDQPADRHVLHLDGKRGQKPRGQIQAKVTTRKDSRCGQDPHGASRSSPSRPAT